jgi:alpha-L-fucosidase
MLSSRAADSSARPVSDSDAPKETRLRWFREARSGLFIRWGVYVIPAGEWKGEHVPGIDEWIMIARRFP